jgi:hypothetical protein
MLLRHMPLSVLALALSACADPVKPPNRDTAGGDDSGRDTGVATEACDNTQDDDGDGAVDCDDVDCDTSSACVVTCWDQDLGTITGASVVTGTTAGAVDDVLSSCSPTAETTGDMTFAWRAPSTDTWRFSVSGSSFDTLLSVAKADCTDEELDCVVGSVLERRVISGQQVLITVDGTRGSAGEFVLGIVPASASEQDCSNGQDDDLDGLADCADSECVGTSYCAGECVDSDLGSTMGRSLATGTTAGRVDNHSPNCSSGSRAEDVTYTWTAPRDGTYVVSTNGSSFDTILFVEQGECTALVPVGCDDDSGDGPQSLVSLDLQNGEQVVITVDGYGSSTGNYVLNITPSEEGDCADGQDDDYDGVTDCDDPDCEYGCPEVRCTDGVDQDGDGAIDCDDSDCDTAPACTQEADCGDGLDDDADGVADCADPACTTVVDGNLGTSTGQRVVRGSTRGGGNDNATACGASRSEDRTYTWRASRKGLYAFTTDNSTFDTVLSVEASTCVTAPELECDDDDGTGNRSRVERMLNVNDTLVLNIEGYATAVGDFQLDILYLGEDCDNGLDDDADGVADCSDSDCAAQCPEAACRNNRDDDQDGLRDCLDPDCFDATGCEAERDCDDGVDDDGDDLVDCADDECTGAPACVSACVEEVLGSGFGDALATGVPAEGSGTLESDCGYYTGVPDVAYAWFAPAAGTFVFTTAGSDYDTILSAADGSCGAAEETCNDDGDGVTDGTSVLVRTMAAGEGVVLVIDGYAQAGTYVLGVRATEEVACADGQDDDGDGTVDCDDTACATSPVCTVEADCDDGLDDDGDGLADCADPSCAGDQLCSDDKDADGVSADTDCDDRDSAIGTAPTWYADADEDGFGDAAAGTEACTAPEGTVANASDCDDTDLLVTVAATWYADTDGDDAGDPLVTTEACVAPDGYVADAGDCDDLDADVETPTWFEDVDGDGLGDAGSPLAVCEPPVGWVADDGDCDDTDGLVGGAATWYVDSDGDAAGDPGVSTQACAMPDGFVATADDCDDADDQSTVRGTDGDCDGVLTASDCDDGDPASTTRATDADCDGALTASDCDDGDPASTTLATDADCDTVITSEDCDDDDVAVGAAPTWYEDRDGDLYAGASQAACDQPVGYTDGSALLDLSVVDCDDDDPAVNVAPTWYEDRDADGYAGSSLEACVQPVGFDDGSGLTSTLDVDCDDDDVLVHPGAAEVCNEVDDDCDGDVDEGVTAPFYADADGDGLGDAGASVQACVAPADHVADDTDCDDGDETIGAATTWYRDGDTDGYAGSAQDACVQPDGHVAGTGLLGTTDCDDDDALVHPGAAEVCNGIDDDCDGDTDEVCPP